MEPNLTTDQLLQLLDGVVEKVEYIPPYNPTTITYKEHIPDYTVTCKQ